MSKQKTNFTAVLRLNDVYVTSFILDVTSINESTKDVFDFKDLSYDFFDSIKKLYFGQTKKTKVLADQKTNLAVLENSIRLWRMEGKKDKIELAFYLNDKMLFNLLNEGKTTNPSVLFSEKLKDVFKNHENLIWERFYTNQSKRECYINILSQKLELTKPSDGQTVLDNARKRCAYLSFREISKFVNDLETNVETLKNEFYALTSNRKNYLQNN